MDRHLLKKRLRQYLEAEEAILSSQSYQIEGLSLTRADLGKVQNMIAKLERELARTDENNLARSRIRFVVPVDGTAHYRTRGLA